MSEVLEREEVNTEQVEEDVYTEELLTTANERESGRKKRTEPVFSCSNRELEVLLCFYYLDDYRVRDNEITRDNRRNSEGSDHCSYINSSGASYEEFKDHNSAYCVSKRMDLLGDMRQKEKYEFHGYLLVAEFRVVKEFYDICFDLVDKLLLQADEPENFLKQSKFRLSYAGFSIGHKFEMKAQRIKAMEKRMEEKGIRKKVKVY